MRNSIVICLAVYLLFVFSSCSRNSTERNNSQITPQFSVARCWTEGKCVTIYNFSDFYEFLSEKPKAVIGLEYINSFEYDNWFLKCALELHFGYVESGVNDTQGIATATGRDINHPSFEQLAVSPFNPSDWRTYRDVFSKAYLSDPKGILTYLNRMPSGELKEIFVGEVFQAALGNSWRDAYTLFIENQRDFDLGMVFALFSNVRDVGVDRIQALIDRITNQDTRELALMASATYYGRNDIDSALVWINTINVNPTTRVELLSNALLPQFSTDPFNALSLLETISGNQIVKNDLVRRLMLSLPQGVDTRGLISWLEGNTDGGSRIFAIGKVLANEIHNNPVSAMQLLGEVVPEQFRMATLEQMGSEWSKVDSRAAFEWINSSSQFSEEEKKLFINEVIEDYARREPLLAAEYIIENGNEQMELAASEAIVRALAHQDLAKATEFIESSRSISSVGFSIDYLLDSVLRNPGVDPFSVINMLPNNAYLYAQKLFSRYSNDNPTLAVNVLERLPSGEEKNHYYDLFSKEWLNRDLDGASNWISGISDPDASSIARSNLAVYMYSSNYEKCIDVISAISNHDVKTWTLNRIAMSPKSGGSAGFRDAVLKSSKLSRAEKAVILGEGMR